VVSELARHPSVAKVTGKAWTAPTDIGVGIDAGSELAYGVAGLLALAVAGGNYWVEMEREEMVAVAQKTLMDPNVQYQKTLAQAWAEVPAPGPHLLRQWQSLMADLPMVHAGWAPC